MKKLFLILMLLCCGFLYAETKTFRVNYTYRIGNVKGISESSYPVWFITAILPYENGYILKMSKLSDENRNVEYFITKGFFFYSYNDKGHCKCTVIDIKPNEFTVEMEEIVTK